MKTVALIPAGGAGTRMECAIPKQYLLLRGIPILVHTLIAIQNIPSVDDIYLILPGEDLEKAKNEILERYRFSKVSRVLAGGKYRQDSVKNGIDAVGADHDIILIHDGVRPFVSQALVESAIREAAETGAVTSGVPVKDTVKTVDVFGHVGETLKRDQIWLTQTPQAFQSLLIKDAYKCAYKDNYYANDDAALVERIGVKVKMILGSYDNIKITTKMDIKWGELILEMRDHSDGF
jgi:2-C-methyl-D-erythritol 4-phosphate cytidylyltransferase